MYWIIDGLESGNLGRRGGREELGKRKMRERVTYLMTRQVGAGSKALL